MVSNGQPIGANANMHHATVLQQARAESDEFRTGHDSQSEEVERL